MSKKSTVIYTDGSVLNHGQSGPQRAGVGAYCPTNKNLNISGPMRHSVQPTSTNAELAAARAVVNRCQSSGVSNFVIRTDSKDVARAMSSQNVKVQQVSRNDSGLKGAHNYAQKGAKNY